MIKQMIVKYKLSLFFLVILSVELFISSQIFAQNTEPTSSKEVPIKKLILSQAAMCEEVKEHTPKNRTVVYSMNPGRAICYTSFDPVPEKTFIYHYWFHMDKLSTKIKLVLHPPRWSTYSRIQLRETDKGPWRVEITDKQGNILRVLRFSVVD